MRHPAPHEDHHSRRQGCIENAGEDQVPRQLEAQLAGTDREAAADRPEDDHEGRRGQDRRQESGDQIDRRIRGDACVLGDAVLRQLRFVRAGIEPTAVVVVEPELEQAIGQPTAPPPLEGHARPDREGGQRDAGGRELRQEVGLVPNLQSVALLQRIEEVAVPDVQSVLHEQLGDHADDERPDEKPGQPASRADSETRGRTPKTPQRSSPHGGGRVFPHAPLLVARTLRPRKVGSGRTMTRVAIRVA